MRILLVYANSFMDNLIPVGVSLLSACLKKAGHETKLFDTTFYRTREKTGDEARVETLQIRETKLDDYGVHEKKADAVDDFKKLVDDYKPGLIAVSIVETTYFIALNLLNGIKDYDIPKAVGGIHATMAPGEVIKEEAVDIVCVGEGEIALTELADRIDKGTDYSDIPNLWVKNDGKVIENPVGPLVKLDDLPDQDWSIWEKERFYKPMGGKVWICGPIEFDRGCPHQCAFCCNAGLQKLYKQHGFYPRSRSVKKFIDEFKGKQKRYGLNYLFVMSENFFQGNGRFNEFVELYRDIKIPFWVETRPETVTEERLKMLKEVGCEGISMGVEHGNDEYRRKVLNRFVSNDAIIKGFQMAIHSGIRVTANNIVGYPEETRELFFDTVEVNRQIKGAYTMINIFSPHRGTSLWKLAVEKGYIPKDTFAGDYRLDSGIDMPHLSKEAIKGLQRTFRLYVYLPKEMWPEIERAEKFDEEGNKAFERLSKIYMEKYMK
ncbi:MAG: B12-binding domain-containing radical SAM protein [Nanoarchaeota archaeon]|nr:B12-binding domain-containing radical SAM protein [Nanoarchaeota archaeon]MBU1005591.1 B12-binding domain-containing radical SAM protein [Nanoarchaeota archaeon]MBU1945977.1 B12-binding domain-containing radical SAM protein [Nanoarchaeota archaeon]